MSVYHINKGEKKINYDFHYVHYQLLETLVIMSHMQGVSMNYYMKDAN